MESLSIEHLAYTCMLIIYTILPFTALLSLLVYIPVYLISFFFSNYGNFTNYFDTWLDEDFVNSLPKGCTAASLILQGDLSLEQLRSIFTEKVLKARSKVNPEKLRYPQLKQYLTSFMGFRIWKNDPNFLLGNHIVEEVRNGTNLADIHHMCLNETFKNSRSPWKIILLRNVNFSGANTQSGSETLLVMKGHHVMADANSLLKLVVECLGKKQLKTASPQLMQKTGLDKVKFVINYPWKCALELCKVGLLFYNNFDHPWKLDLVAKSDNQNNKTFVAFSPKIMLSNLKQVAREHNVKTSAVVMSIIAGAIRKYLGSKWEKNSVIGYPMPKPNHPEFLTNHLYMSIMGLPTDQKCEFKRLQECNEEFVRVKKEQQVKYTNITTLIGGLQMYPFSRLALNAFLPIGLTNIAGDEEGFFVGDAECVDFRMSVGTLPGVAGVVFSCNSYKDWMTIAVIAKESILSKEVVSSLAEYIEYELQLLIISP